MKNSFKSKLIIFVIFLFALSLRLYALNWDANFHLHPDERFLTMVATDLRLPSSLSQYFNAQSSPLNPYNYSQYQFFVYGTFPIFLVKFLAVQLHLDDYNNITLLGRVLSALFDSGNVILLYFLAKKFLKSFYLYLPSLFYAILVLPLQLSHFFAVDTFLTFFLLLTFTFLSYNLLVPAFLVFGLALSCKISALYFLPVIFLFLLQKKKIISILVSNFLLLVSILSFRIFQPYAFSGLITPNSLFIDNLKSLASYATPSIFYPPSVQWINRLPLWHAFTNISLWGLGLAFSLPLIFYTLRFLFRSKLKINFSINFLSLSAFWILFLYFFQGSQFINALRYFLPLFPFLCLVFAALLFHFKVKRSLVILIFCLNFIYSLAFLSIYSRPHSRVEASSWINQNIAQDATLSSEYWDDALPLGYSNYENITLALFDPDSPQKWEKINSSLGQVDYLILSSSRLWASISRLPDYYPQSALFYQNLFAQKTNFHLLKRFVSYPGFSLPFLKSCYYFGPSIYPGTKNSLFEKDANCSYPGIYLRDDSSEEPFTVYDHPQVLIFTSQKSN